MRIEIVILRHDNPVTKEEGYQEGLELVDKGYKLMGSVVRVNYSILRFER